MRVTPLRTLSSLVLLLGISVCAFAAQESIDGVDNYRVTRWDTSDGAPGGGIFALAQDASGYIWLGSADGLFRFDGFRFERWSELSADRLAGSVVRSLLLDREGTIWAGFDDGGVSRIVNGHARNYGPAQGLAHASVRAIVEDGGSNVWAGTLEGLYTLHGERWQRRPLDDRAGPQPIFDALYETNGTLVVATADALLRLRPGASAFEKFESHQFSNDGLLDICEDSHGHIVRTDSASGFRVLPEASSGHSASAMRAIGARLHCARDATVWVGTRYSGLWRIDSGQARSVGTHRIGLAQAAVSLTEDRNQNIWVGTSNGIYRLTPWNVRTLPHLPGVAAVAADRQGKMWVGTADGLARFTRTRGGWEVAERFLRGVRIRALHADERGAVWIATNQGVLASTAGSPFAAPSWGRTLAQVRSMSSGPRGTLWLYDDKHGLARVDGDRLEVIDLPGDLKGVPNSVIHADQRGRVWLVNTATVAAREPDGRLRRYTVADGLTAGGYRSIYEDAAGVVWLGGETGVSRLVEGRFETVHIPGVHRGSWVKTIVEDGRGDLWLGIDRGGIRFSRASFEYAARSPGGMLTDRFEVFDGLPGAVRALGDHAVARTGNGELWFITDAGIGIVDPDRILPSLDPIPTRISSVRADNEAGTAVPPTMLPARTTRLMIAWAALDLTTPQRAHFRYRLDGFDREWVDAGKERMADYADLKPGTYVFRVMAARNGQAWFDNGATWRFTIAPHLYQAAWFPFACAMVFVLAGCIVWYLLLAQARWRFSIVLNERARVSREIHDTLLQSLVGVALLCQALANSIDSSDVRDELIRLRKHVDGDIHEARESIWNLRSPMLDRDDLVGLLRRAAEEATHGTPVRCEVTTRGTDRPCPPKVEQELLRVGREAISNAVRHGQPSAVRIEVDFLARAIRLSVRDDGSGFSPGDTAGHLGHHCGLAMMRERSEGIGGRFSVESGRGRGTEVEVLVPLSPAGAA